MDFASLVSSHQSSESKKAKKNPLAIFIPKFLDFATTPLLLILKKNLLLLSSGRNRGGVENDSSASVDSTAE